MNEKFRYFLCGLLMGTADTIPGVSGGTIAFITGIYGKLLETIKSVDKEFFRLLFSLQIKKAFAKIPFGFAVPLLLGIGTAIASLAKIMVMLLADYADNIWAFFFGLILSSLHILVQEIKDKNPQKMMSLIFFVLGIIFSLWISFTKPIPLTSSYPVIFFSGFFAICAMILPGISGAFLLVLIGQYQTILNAVANFNLPVIGCFILGCICGVLIFAHVISACLNNFYHVTLSFLSGILAGSLAMLFPFQANQTFSHNVLLTGLIVIGAAIPLVINYIGKKHYLK